MTEEEEKRSHNPIFGDTPSIAEQVNKAAEEQGRKGGETEEEREEREEEERRRSTRITNDESIADHLHNDEHNLSDSIWGE